ncbi:transmembrane protein 135 [Plakobranchus ocellatus]|uniref:Transmembrane protein 135 n=1 Tax=Plakobranchus ocellatus TaxID=259542 RepID=A0AAV4AGC9_9GAST|nr:transmembrane protein 135 [Plakobranchus ocellatus]
MLFSKKRFIFRKQNGLSPSAESLFRFFVGESENPKRDLKWKQSTRSSKEETAEGLASSGSTSSAAATRPGGDTTKAILDNAKTAPSIGNSSAPSSSAPSSSTSPLATRSSYDPSHKPEDETSRNQSKSSNSSTAQRNKHVLSWFKLMGLTQRLVRTFPALEEPVRRLLEMMCTGVESLEALPRHRCCPHKHSCLSYILKGGGRMFALGYLLQASISSLSVLSTIIRRPAALRDTLFSKLNLKLAAFMAGYSAIFRAVNCILRWARGKDSPSHGLVGGALAGLSLRFYRSVTIALYAATKLVEVRTVTVLGTVEAKIIQGIAEVKTLSNIVELRAVLKTVIRIIKILYFKGIESYGFPYFKSADIFIYAFSTAFIFHAAVMEPHTLRPGYWKFLLRVTGNKFAMMNRRLLDVFGVNSSKIAPDYWPNYDPAFTQLARGPS